MVMLTPLGALIERVKAERGDSDEDIARRARRKGSKISKQNVALMRQADPLRTLVPGSLRALADGLEVPLARVVEAALGSAGLPMPAPPADWAPETAIQLDPDLPAAAKRMLLHQLSVARQGGTEATIHPMPRKVTPGRRAARRREEP